MSAVRVKAGDDGSETPGPTDEPGTEDVTTKPDPSEDTSAPAPIVNPLKAQEERHAKAQEERDKRQGFHCPACQAHRHIVVSRRPKCTNTECEAFGTAMERDAA